MPELQPLVEDDNERPALETVEALLGRRMKVRGWTCRGQLASADFTACALAQQA